MSVYQGYCPFHGEVEFLDFYTYKECKEEREQHEKDRWNFLTLEQRIEELKERLDSIENTSRLLG